MHHLILAWCPLRPLGRSTSLQMMFAQHALLLATGIVIGWFSRWIYGQIRELWKPSGAVG